MGPAFAALALTALLGALTVGGWAPRLAGKFLNRLNQNRRPWGRAWESLDKSRAADAYLDDQAAQTSRLRRRAELAASLPELAEILPTDRTLQLSAETFLRLLQDLPEPLRTRLASWEEVPELFLSGRWTRTAVRRDPDGVTAFLLDGRNRVLATVSLDGQTLQLAAAWSKERPGKLADDPRFAGGTFLSLAEFRAAVSRLPDTLATRLFPGTDLLSLYLRRPAAVGIAPAPAAPGFTLVGFEFVARDTARLLTCAARTDVLAALSPSLGVRQEDPASPNSAAPTQAPPHPPARPQPRPSTQSAPNPPLHRR